MSHNLHSLLTIAAEMRAVGHSWDAVAAKVQRRPRTCQNWTSRHRSDWEALYHEAQTRRFHETSEEAHTLLKNLMRDDDKKVRYQAIALWVKSGAAAYGLTGAMKMPVSPQTVHSYIDEKLHIMRESMIIARREIDARRAREGLPPATNDEFDEEMDRYIEELEGARGDRRPEPVAAEPAVSGNALLVGLLVFVALVVPRLDWNLEKGGDRHTLTPVATRETETDKAVHVSYFIPASHFYNVGLPNRLTTVPTPETPMPLNVPITEEMVRGLSPDDATWAKAEELAGSDRFLNPGVSPDGTWLLADAKGSGKDPYHVSADFVDVNTPILRSTSPSRQSPDKYTLALLLKYARQPDSFGVREPSEDLAAKREKKVAADERKKFGPGAPKREKKSAEAKQLIAQREGLETLDRLLMELVAGGKWFEEGHIEKLERISKSLSDAHLPTATYALRRLLLVGKQKAIGEDERMLVAADLIGQLWAIVQQTKIYLEGKLPEGESQEIADAVTEELLGRPWHISDLKEKGYWKEDVSLLELAYERTDDDARQQRIEVSNLIDLGTGDIVQSIAYRPYKSVNPVPEQASYAAPLTISGAAVYPGFLNRRIAWEKGAEKIGRPSPESIETAYGLAVGDFAAILEAFRDQLRHPLAPREGVFLLQCETIGKVGDRIVVLEDASGARIEAADRRKDYSNTANLVRAVAMLGREKPAVLAKLYVQPMSNAVVALPLAALTAKHHLRLGL